MTKTELFLASISDVYAMVSKVLEEFTKVRAVPGPEKVVVVCQRNPLKGCAHAVPAASTVSLVARMYGCVYWDSDTLDFNRQFILTVCYR